MRILFLLIVFVAAQSVNAQKSKPNVVVIFAHPDEGEIYAGGITALYTSMGHRVKFMSLTNGDAGHYAMKPADLAKRRLGEAMEAKEILGVAEYEVLDYHDKFLKNTGEVQEKVIRSIQGWNADIVFTYYPAEGGHPDNMTAGWIVRDAAPRLKMEKKPVFIYIRDFHTTKFSNIPDFAVSIDKVWEKKLASCAAHRTQVEEAIPYKMGILEEVKKDKGKQRQLIYNNTYPFSNVTPDILIALKKWFGNNEAMQTKYAEAFSVAEFGRQVTDDELKSLLPVEGKIYELPATTGWLDTGIDVRQFDMVNVNAEGAIVWKMDGRESCGPGGAEPYTRWGNKPLPGVSTGALIGRIGEDNSQSFLIGERQQIVINKNGRLYIGINDDNTDDNEGSYRVWIKQTGKN
jgi:LmbE family N-acetylglucosaminyl deacetylase